MYKLPTKTAFFSRRTWRGRHEGNLGLAILAVQIHVHLFIFRAKKDRKKDRKTDRKKDRQIRFKHSALGSRNKTRHTVLGKVPGIKHSKTSSSRTSGAIENASTKLPAPVNINAV
jgi:hypothetical protein